MASLQTPHPRWPLHVGRTFLHPVVDYLTIGGGISLIAAVILWFVSGRASVDRPLGPYMAGLFLACNSAHFAASTVRLYTKPGAIAALPFLTLAFPLVTLLITLLTIILASSIGTHYFSLYMTWSPYHYCAQAYGLAVMYCYRSGCRLTLGDKRLIYWTAIATFIWTIISTPQQKAGVWWVLDYEWLQGHPAALQVVMGIRAAARIIAIASPAALVLWLHLRRNIAMPAIGLMPIVVNVIWLAFFPLIQGFALATVCHSIQYLVIVCIFHVKDQMQIPENRHGVSYHTAWFYGACLLLGYALFALLPAGLSQIGMGPVESSMMVVTSINIHHFIVDAYIWKIGRDPNYRIVTDTAAGTTAAG